MVRVAMSAASAASSKRSNGKLVAMHRRTAKRPLVVVLVADRLGLFEFSAASEIFGDDISSSVSGWYRFAVASAGDSTVSTHIAGIEVRVDRDLSALREASTIVVPPSILQRHMPDEVAAELRRAHARGTRIASLCTGAFILARAGLLNGREATTHWSSTAELAEQYPEISVNPGVLYIDDGDILTSAGSAASLDLCVHIVRNDFGAEIANLVAREMVIPPHREGGQAQYVSQPVPSSFEGDPFADALSWAIDHLSENPVVEELAERATMSPRTFARKFRAITGTTPHQWLNAQRLFYAQRLLETTNLSIDLVAEKSGFGTATNLRQQFQRATGTAPSIYRRTFRTAS